MSSEDSLAILISCALRNLTERLEPDDVRRALGIEAEAAYRQGGVAMLEAHVEQKLEQDGYLITSPTVTGVVQLARTATAGTISDGNLDGIVDLTEATAPSNPAIG